MLICFQLWGRCACLLYAHPSVLDLRIKHTLRALFLICPKQLNNWAFPNLPANIPELSPTKVYSLSINCPRPSQGSGPWDTSLILTWLVLSSAAFMPSSYSFSGMVILKTSPTCTSLPLFPCPVISCRQLYLPIRTRSGQGLSAFHMQIFEFSCFWKLNQPKEY